MNWGRVFSVTALAPASGVLLTLSFAPFHLWPLGLVALALWLCGVQAAPNLRAALNFTLLWGMAHGVSALYWLPWAFWHDSGSLVAALGGGGLAVLGLALWVALGYVLVVTMAWRFRTNPWAYGVVVVVGILVVETLRNLTPYGFPWLPLGAVWAGDVWGNTQAPTLAQLASVGSVQLLTGVFIMLGVLVATLKPRAWLAAALVLAGTWGFGAWRLQASPPPSLANTGQPVVRVVQPNLSGQHKWDEQRRWQFLNATLNIATSPSMVTPSLVILPETGVPFFLAQAPEARRWLAMAFGGSSTLITGSVRREEGVKPQFYNSLQVIDNGEVTASYDKHLLVPFGEFIPLRSLLEALPLPSQLRTLSQSRLDFTHGVAAPLLATPVGNALGLICYEGIFPLFVAQHAAGANFLVNVTNDAWFTGTTALYQHAALQRLRSIETGLPLLRSANTGISLVIDGYGRQVAALAPNTAGVLDVPLPQALPATGWRKFWRAVDY